MCYYCFMKLNGTIKTIIYRSEETGFTVLELADETGEEVTAVGLLPLTNVGERIELEGEWTEHRAYGRQFKAESCRTLAPATLEALISYLSSGLIKGVGDSTARLIVDAFGMDTLNVLENEPGRLKEIYGIGPSKAGIIAASYLSQLGMRDVMLALSEYGVSVTQAMKLYKRYGDNCIGYIRDNPYRLIEEVEGIGFKTADKIAMNAGLEADSAYRLRAGVRYALQWARQEGHTCLPREKLVEVAADLLNAQLRPVEHALDDLIINSQLAYKIVDGTDAVFLPDMFFMESECAKRLNHLNRPPARCDYSMIDHQIDFLEKSLHITLHPQQRSAVYAALTSGALVITGGPGTGKTTILEFILRISEQLGLSCELCAPTGRAAKRMTEATGTEARTVHRLLEYGYGQDSFARNEEYPLDTDMVIVDEMSMVDVPLMHALLKAIAPGTRLIMVGDADQLPSVGAGSVLHDIIGSLILPVARLTEVFRQSERSLIVENAHRINRGAPPVVEAESGEFGFEYIDNKEDVLRRTIALCMGRTNKLGTRDPLKDVQVLAPMKKGTLGVYNLNARLQAALNPPAPKKRERKYGETVFREGDKVMQVKNNYRIEWAKKSCGDGAEGGQGVFNGDLGTILHIDFEAQTVQVLFDDERCAIYEFSMLEELELAYCISIHKSQGSEFPVVLMPLVDGPPQLLTRNLLYTAVTRARKQVYIVGHESCILHMVRNSQVKKRYSGLKSFLTELSVLTAAK
ncbi:MAG TPA: ATP-dependent RecD-like DNA helicase [Clostridia bacterium]|nr:ATP-dependent RecD-like DNA helicase [Clostridia bacterium]